MNLREQQDAVQFYISLTNSIDEALKALDHEQIMHRTCWDLLASEDLQRMSPSVLQGAAL